MDLHCRFQLINGVGAARVRTVTEHKLVGRGLFVGQAARKGDGVAVVGNQRNRVVVGVIFGDGRFPGEQPRLVDVVLRHVRQELSQVMAMPIWVIVGVDNAH